MRGLLAAAVLLAGLFGSSWVAAQNTGRDENQDTALLTAQFQDYFAATAQRAAIGARNEMQRKRQVGAALLPLVTQFLIHRRGQIAPMIRGLTMASPNVAPDIVHSAIASFPGFADQIAQAAGYSNALYERAATSYRSQRSAPVSASPAVRMGQRQIQHKIDGHAVHVAAWAVSAIARNSVALEQIMAQAMAAAPGREAAVASAIVVAFPGFSPRIAAATGVRMAPPARSAQRPTPSPTQKLTPPARQPAISQAAPPRRPPPAPLPGVLILTDSDEDDGEISDPLEPMNRIFFATNETIDQILLRPIAIGYNWIMPDPVIEAMRRLFLNLDSPAILANDLLQGDFRDAGVTAGRFSVNTTIGLLGLFDPAAKFGWKRHHADFGQTLFTYNIGEGPYLFLPLLGPTSTRGGVGKIVDIFFQPLTYLLSTGPALGVNTTRAVVKREELLDPLGKLRENSIDYYTGLKAAYWQARQIELNKGTLIDRGDGSADKLFDAAD